MRIADYSVTKAVLERHGFTFKKSFGQNFLTDTAVVLTGCKAARENYII